MELDLIGLFIICFASATVIPFSSEAAVLAYYSINDEVFVVLLVASLGNWLGGVLTYYLGNWSAGFLHRYAWIQKKLDSTSKWHKYVDKYGPWCGFLSWLPFIGDGLVFALGLFKTNKFISFTSMLMGKAIRYYLLLMFTEVFF